MIFFQGFLYELDKTSRRDIVGELESMPKDELRRRGGSGKPNPMAKTRVAVQSGKPPPSAPVDKSFADKTKTVTKNVNKATSSSGRQALKGLKTFGKGTALLGAGFAGAAWLSSRKRKRDQSWGKV